MRLYLIFFICCFFRLSLILGAEQEIQSVGILATVNGTPITLTDVLQYSLPEEEQAVKLYTGNKLQNEIKRIRKKSLNNIIDRELIYEKFKTYNTEIPRDFIEENMDRLVDAFNLSSRDELEKIANVNGLSMSDLREKAYRSLAIDALIYDKCYRNIFISPKDVYKYYQKNKNKFIMPTEYNLSLLTLRKNAKEHNNVEAMVKYLKKTILNKNKIVFDNAVKLYSDGPNIDKNGNIGWIKVKEIRQDFLDCIKRVGAEKGQVYGPCLSGNTYFFIRINDIKKSSLKSFEEVKKQIETYLRNKQRDINYKKFIKKLRENAEIQYYNL